MEKATVKRKLVSPAQAQIWLLKNKVNRPLSDRIVRYLVDQIKRGKWELTTDAIGFNEDGDLINGQHRLTAAVKTGKTLELLVADNLTKTSFNVIDTGKIRTAGDILGAAGYAASHAKSAIIRFVVAYKKGRQDMASHKATGRTELNLSNQEVLDYAEKHKQKVEEAYDVSVKACKSFKGIKTRLAGGIYWILSDIDKDHALSFFYQLGTGVGLKADDPIYILRERLISEMGPKKKHTEKEKLAWIFICWNHTRKGSKLKQLKWKSTDGLPKPV